MGLVKLHGQLNLNFLIPSALAQIAQYPERSRESVVDMDQIAMQIGELAL